MRNIDEKKYEQYVKQLTPTHSLPLNMAKAFLTGGLICLLGQVIINTALALGADTSDARTWCSVLLILLSVILTGFGIYPKIGKFGGAGSLVPITGFANSVAASAIEFRAEGQVFGIGCKIFTIAGPVILYGILSAWALGVIYYILKLLEVISLLEIFILAQPAFPFHSLFISKAPHLLSARKKLMVLLEIFLT